MNITQKLKQLYTSYSIIGEIDLDKWHDMPYEQAQEWLESTLAEVYREKFESNERILFVQRKGDVYVKGHTVGLIAKNLIVALENQDITPSFVVYLNCNNDLVNKKEYLHRLSNDPNNKIEIFIDTENPANNQCLDKYPMSRRDQYMYGSVNPLKINLNDLTERERYLLTESKKFCMYPWVHLHAWPTGQAFPCCMSEPAGQVGNTKHQTLKEIWNGDAMKQLRVNMMIEQSSEACTRCYEQEESGFFSGRLSANKHHGHLISKVGCTAEDGNNSDFELTYWDIRFSNLCNLSCRSCGHIFSSNWYKDQVAIAGSEYGKNNTALNFAGRYETDIWEQLEPHLDYVEQIYFAGGEPLMMEEHYKILEELERRGRFDVRLIYNTNFTHVKLKDRLVFDYWKKFESVAVGASLDAMGPRAEYIRKGTNWQIVEENRRQMQEICPEVDFYISPTLSVLNVFHLPEFHRNWTEREFIRAQDLNVNILQDPKHLRIDILPAGMKREVKKIYQDHIEWLKPQDKLNRATVGYESAIRFLEATDNSHFNLTFIQKTQELDRIRKERCIDVLPELGPIL